MTVNIKNIIESKVETDFRAPTVAKKLPRAVADGVNGIIIAVADIAGTPEQVFQALSTNEVEKWWKYPGFYHQKDWKSDVRALGSWSVTVQLNNGNLVHGFGEFCEVTFPNKIVMTRRFDAHPFLGDRETTITYYLESSTYGTLLTLRDEGYIGRAQAAYGNTEIWEKVLSWLDAYLIDESSTCH